MSKFRQSCPKCINNLFTETCDSDICVTKRGRPGLNPQAPSLVMLLMFSRKAISITGEDYKSVYVASGATVVVGSLYSKTIPR